MPDHQAQQAISYAQQGLKVFPCHYPTSKATCSCGYAKCKSIGKHPRIKRWSAVASCDASEVAQMWQQFPESNVAILTGEVNQLDVLDVDPKNGGLTSLDTLPKLPPTLTTKTGSGGYHFWFSHTPALKNNNTGKIAPGIDFRTTGGYVIAPPSLHVSGNTYEWHDISEPVSPPDWLYQKLKIQYDGNKTQRERSPEDSWEKFAQTEKFVEQQRHNAITRVAGLLINRKVHPHVAALLAHCFNKQHCDPPKSDEEVNKAITWIITNGN